MSYENAVKGIHKILVTQADVDRGDAQSEYLNPVALAISAALTDHTWRVRYTIPIGKSVLDGYYYATDQYQNHYALEDRVTDFLELFEDPKQTDEGTVLLYNGSPYPLPFMFEFWGV